ILGGFIFGYELALWNISVVLVNATIPTLLVNLSCIWVGIFSYLVLKEKISITHWIGTSIALLGVLVIIGYVSLIGLKMEKGVLFAITCSFMISVYTLIVKRARRRMDSVSVLFYTLIGSMLALIIWALIGRVNLVPSSNQSWFYLIGLGVIVQGLGYLSINYALGYISSAKVTLTLLLQPVFTGILAVFVLNERLKENQLMGSLLVLLGLVISFIKIDRKMNLNR
ncbi:MAG: DMT family transporter, partial [Mobilitalea sp.]